MTFRPNLIASVVAAGAVSMVILLLAVIVTPVTPVNYTCYNGHKYKVDSRGVLWPVQTRFGVQKCEE